MYLWDPGFLPSAVDQPWIEAKRSVKVRASGVRASFVSWLDYWLVVTGTWMLFSHILGIIIISID